MIDFALKAIEGFAGELGKGLALLLVGVFGSGGLAGFGLARFFGREPLATRDFRILKETTVVIVSPIRQKSDSLSVRVERDYEMKLRAERRRGMYKLLVDLKGNNIDGKWENGCQFFKNDDAVPGLAFGEEGTVIKSKPFKVSSRDILKLTLKSTETVTRKRGFYGLVINNPKEKTQFSWKLNGFTGNDFKARAFASSEDFDLIVLPPDAESSISESTHPVAYFITWSREFVA